MTPKDRDKTSKFLSLILRHKPETIGIRLTPEGWADTSLLLEKLDISMENLREVVELNDKKRFILSEDSKRIRANQGHSISVDLELMPATPPELLYHGTAARNIASIMENGILKRGRNHVHLSECIDTTTQVGARYGKPVVLKVRASDMHADGQLFFRSENNVWLTDFVPSEFIIAG